MLSNNILLKNVKKGYILWDISGFPRCVADTYDLAQCLWVGPAQRVGPTFRGQNVEGELYIDFGRLDRHDVPKRQHTNHPLTLRNIPKF
jgi:hypothetical protein